MERVHGSVEGHGRWCAVHGRFHGVFFRCPHYGEEVLAEIRRGEGNFEESLKTVEDPVVRGVFEFFRGGSD